MRVLVVFLFPFLLLAGCATKEKVDDSQTIGTQKVIRAMPTPGRIEDARRGKEEWFAYGAVSGVEGAAANGVAKAHLFENRTFLHTVDVNIDIPKKGFFYEGWLQEEGGGDMVSTGHFVNRFGDTRHHLTFETQRNLRDHQKVILTLERDDGDPAPGKRVAEGMLKVVER